MFDHRGRSSAALGGLAVVVCGLASGCGAGGSSGGPAPISFEFASASMSASETGVTTIGVRLVLTIPQLEEDASVELYDSGAGSAASGADYDPVPTQTLVFPAGSTDGTIRTVDITSHGDSAFEGNETVNLQLSNPSSGSGLGAQSTITVEITESEPATLQFAAPAGAALEGAGTVQVAVELGLSPGVVLDRELSFQVADALSGSASAFVDYTLLPQTLTFPVGSTDGATQDAQVTLIGDTIKESDETLVLQLREPGLNASLGFGATHTLTITDDDASPNPYFEATATGLGTLVHGQALALGSQSVDSGPNAGIQMTVSNQGQQPMSLFAPSLSGANPNDFAVEASISPLVPGAGTVPEVLPSPVAAMFEHPTDGVELAVDAALLQPLRDSNRVVLGGFPLPGGATCELELERVRSPWASDAVLYHNGVPVPGGPQSLCGDLSVWRGAIVGDDDSSAFLSFSEHGCRGWIRTSPAPEDIVHLVTDFDLSGPEPLQRARLVQPLNMIAAGANQTAPASVCNGALVPPGEEDPASMVLANATTAGLTLSDCRVAVETDYQFFQEFGNQSAATAYITQLFAAVSDVYLRDVQTTLSIAYLGIHTSSNDPWSTPDTNGSTGDMLTEFRTAWLNNWPVQADLAHFVSGASLGGGIAYVNVLCSNSFGFGVSGSLNANIDWGSWTGQSSFLNWDFVVVAHEIGHNFSASHTHNYCPPLDQCSASNCNGTQVCSRGTIMSYCHTCSGGLSNIDLEFHPQIANQMRGAVNASCLGRASLATGESLDYRVRFHPTSSAGAKSAVLNVSHTAPNAPTPFQLNLSGTATP